MGIGVLGYICIYTPPLPPPRALTASRASSSVDSRLGNEEFNDSRTDIHADKSLSFSGYTRRRWRQIHYIIVIIIKSPSL